MQQSAMATGQEWSATLNTITNSEELGLPAGSWWKLVVEGSMLEIVTSQASPEAAVGELGLGKGRQQLAWQPWSFTSISILHMHIH